MLGNKRLEERIRKLEKRQDEIDAKSERFINMIANLTATVQQYETEIHSATEDMYKNRNGLYDRRALQRRTSKYFEEEEGNE